MALRAFAPTGTGSVLRCHGMRWYTLGHTGITTVVKKGCHQRKPLYLEIHFAQACILLLLSLFRAAKPRWAVVNA